MGRSKDLATGETRFVNATGDSMVNDGEILKLSRTSGASENLIFSTQAAAGISGTTHVGQLESAGNNALEVFTTSAHPIHMGTNNAVRMTVDGSGKLGVGNTSPYAKLHVEGDSYYGGPKWGTWTETMTTTDGGSQTVRIVEDWTGRWVLCGRWAANAATSVTGIWSSVRGLSTSTSQSETTAFSADFGQSYPTECRFLGATDFTNYYNTRTIDFIHGVPAGRPWELFMSKGETSGMGQVTGAAGGAKYGWEARGAYDGFGRWSNPNYQYHKIADVGGGGMVHSSAAFRTPTNNAFNWNVTSDAKVTVNGTGLNYSGQDTTLTSGFGSDDTTDNKFGDVWPSLANNMGLPAPDFTSAVWVLIKFSGI